MGKRLGDNLSSEYISAANKMKSKTARRRIVAYVESYDDVFFWRMVLSEFENDKRYFEVMLPSKVNLSKGKKTVLMNLVKDKIGKDMIACVDADYDYLLQGATSVSKQIIESPYVFHTYVYAIENFQCYAPSLHDVCVMVTLNDHSLIDFEEYFRLYSQAIFPLFVWNIMLYRTNHYSEFTMTDFNRVIETGSFNLQEPLNGVMNDENLYVTIDIDMTNTDLAQMIYVKIGSKYINGIDYTESYTVSVNGDTPSEPEDVVITIDENSDNTIDFVLRNFSFNISGSTITIDEFSIDDIPTQEGDGELINFYKEGTLSLPTNGLPREFKLLIDAGVFDNVPFTIDGKYTSDKLFATINLDVIMGIAGSTKIDIVVGTDDFVVNVEGDLDGDGKVNFTDAQSVLTIMANEEYDAAADVDHNGKVDFTDYQSILLIMAN